MSKFTTIPKGYRITVTTWENDGDNYKTKSVEGYTLEEAKFLIDFSKLFASKNCHNGIGIGNIYDDMDADLACEQVAEVVAKHPVTTTSEKFVDYFSSEDGWHEFGYDLGLTGEEFYTRVLDGYKVEHIPEEIKIQDVTDQF